MFSLSSTFRYYYYSSATDTRKGFDGLCGLVHAEIGRGPVSGEVFIFVNHQRNKIKLLHWEAGGFVLYYKRLERGTFEMPRVCSQGKPCQISWSSLMLIVEAISTEKYKQRRRYVINNLLPSSQ
ncbi:MAG: IS66 family insertion sequence element accessory protein TnpB [Bacteroidales bacterium]